jgi:ribose/xylose/arabinose/galactoside ABC-type transport system permease subunit
MAIARPDNFLRMGNMMNILRQTAVIGILALSMTLVLLSGGIDLSVGSVVAFSGVIAAYLAAPGGPAMAKFGYTRGAGVSEALAMGSTLPVIVPVLGAMAVGALVGLVNGFFIAVGRVPPFIVTMGMMTIVRGVALLASGGGQLPFLTDEFKAIGRGSVFNIPYLALFFIALIIIISFILKNTCFGRHVYAVGGNETAANVSGIRVVRTKILVYVIAGMCAGVSGMLLASRTAVGSPLSGTGYELDAIASCVIGGVSLSGGVGGVFGTVVGVMFIAVMGNGMDMLSINPYFQQITKGAIVILAVLYDVSSRRRK